MRSGYKGSPSLQTSTANVEIVPAPPSGWTQGYTFITFSFMNDQDCTVIINSTETIFLRAGQGFNVTEDDAPITSFKIVTAGVTYNWVATY